MVFKKGQKAWNKGKHWSEETKRKIGLISKGRKHTEEWKKMMSKRMSGKKSPRYKHGLSKTREYNSIYQKRHRARKKNADGSHTLGEWENLKSQYNWTCPCCEISEPKIQLTEDHIIPLSKGGSDNIENIQPLCRGCNSKKNTKIINFYKNK